MKSNVSPLSVAVSDSVHTDALVDFKVARASLDNTVEEARALARVVSNEFRETRASDSIIVEAWRGDLVNWQVKIIPVDDAAA